MESSSDWVELSNGVGSSASTLAARASADAELAPLLPALRRGDSTAFHRVVELNGPWMLHLARHLLRKEEDAQDVTQEAFLAAFRAMDSFLGNARLSTWLHRVLVNAALMRMRQRRRKSEPLLEGDLTDQDRERAPGLTQVDWTESPLDQVERSELRAAVRKSIDDLPEIHRTILLLRDIEEMDTAAVAEHLGVSTQVVKTRLHRARQILRARIEPLLGFDLP